MNNDDALTSEVTTAMDVDGTATSSPGGGYHTNRVVYVRPGDTYTLNLAIHFGELHLRRLSEEGFVRQVLELVEFRAREQYGLMELVSK